MKKKVEMKKEVAVKVAPKKGVKVVAKEKVMKPMY